MHPDTRQSLQEVHASVDTDGKKSPFRRLLAFMGPAYLVSVGYMDPGNWATDIAGGSAFGYRLIWVLLMSNLMALLLQSLSVRLGLVRKLDLAQASRATYPRPVNLVLYALAEVAIAATDLAEILGMAIGLQLLTGLPLLWGVGLTVFDTLLFLLLQRSGMRKMEVFIIVLISVIGGAFVVEMFLARPDVGEIARGFVPGIPNAAALYLAIGIIGATVMPHNLYLHSALVQTRRFGGEPEALRRAIRFNFYDSAIALNLAFFVNAAILILAASAFHRNGLYDVAEIQDAHRLLSNLLGTELAPTLFAIALIAAGQSSTITGTLAGQIVMEGYLHLRLQPWLRRLLTRLLAVVPAFLVIYIYGEEETGPMLIFSQVLLSLQLGFAIVPLIHLVSDRATMGDFAISLPVRVLAWLITAVIVALNVQLVLGEVAGWLAAAGPRAWVLWVTVVPALAASLGLLLYLIFRPVDGRARRPS
nr:Nramp family divalent metal transporter [Lewinella sp. IMCC34183]